MVNKVKNEWWYNQPWIFKSFEETIDMNAFNIIIPSTNWQSYINNKVFYFPFVIHNVYKNQPLIIYGQ